ncbi:MAG: hypothetical protein ACE5JS_03325 [Nitrospinota bacterium]
MSLNEFVDRVLRGAFAGLLGGIVFGIWMAEKGGLVAIASMAGARSPVVGLVIHLVISIGIGGSFAVIFSRLALGLIPSVLWGLVYGFFWWFLGPLTLMALMMGMGLQWTASAVAGTVPSLIWHLVFGGVLGVSYEALRRESVASLFGRG